jgi:hypothetical protein
MIPPIPKAVRNARNEPLPENSFTDILLESMH